MSPSDPVRWRLTLPLLIPSLGGLAYLHAYDAPARLIAVNAGALALGLVWVLAGRMPAGNGPRLALGALAAGLLFLPLLSGPDLGGVSRWLPAGPVTLQSGPLLLPLLLVLAARTPRFGAAMLAIAGAALALQPDAAGLAALAAAGIALAWLRRSFAFPLVAAGAAAGATATFGAGALAPQLYTEGVLAHVASRAPWQAGVLAILLFVAPLWQLVLRPQLPREDGWALAAVLVAPGVIAAAAPFPFPLIGYGAAPILGFALALGVAAPHFRPDAPHFAPH